MASQPLRTGIEGVTYISYVPPEELTAPPPLTGTARARWSVGEDGRWERGQSRRLRIYNEDLAWVDACGVCPLCRWVDENPGVPLPFYDPVPLPDDVLMHNGEAVVETTLAGAATLGVRPEWQEIRRNPDDEADTRAALAEARRQGWSFAGGQWVKRPESQ